MSFQGKKNIYTCASCGEHVVTVDIHEGVTPFMIQCRSDKSPGCKGLMQSSMYRVFDQSMKPDFEWYKPSAVEHVELASRDHVSQGGLLLRSARTDGAL